MPSIRKLRGALLPALVVLGVFATALVVALTGGQPAQTGADTETPANLTQPADDNAMFGRGRDHGCHAPETIALPRGLRPEGVTSDGASTFYVGSLADGRIVTGDLRTGDTRVLVPGVDGRRAVGTLLDRRNDRIWAAGGDTGAVTAYDARSGRQLGRWLTPGSVFLNDLTITRDAVYVTDSGMARLVVIPLGPGGELPAADGATTLPLRGDIPVDPGTSNANGIRALDRDTLLVVHNGTGGLFLVDPDTGDTDEVQVTRGELTGGDGLELGDGHLFVVRGTDDESVTMLRLDQSGATARVEQVLRDTAFDVPSTATFAGGHLWVVNARFDTEPTPTTPYSITRVDPR
jgi:hypothetical protein